MAAASFTFIAYLQLALICILAPVFMAGRCGRRARGRGKCFDDASHGGADCAGESAGAVVFIVALMVATLLLFALTQYFGGVDAGDIRELCDQRVCGAAGGTIAMRLLCRGWRGSGRWCLRFMCA